MFTQASKRFFSRNKRYFSIEKYQYVSDNGNVVSDFILTKDTNSSYTREEIKDKINGLLEVKNSILLLTQPSRFLRKDGHNFVPVNPQSMKDIINLKEGKYKLIPDPGHICVAITNDDSEITGDLSFRPDKNRPEILGIEVNLHPEIYGNNKDSMTGRIQRSFFETFLSEVDKASTVIDIDPTSRLCLSVIQGKNINFKLSNLCEIFEETKDRDSIYHMAVYNLCSGFVKQQDVENLREQNVSASIESLIREAEKINYPDIPIGEGKHRIAAHACGHALARVFFEDAHRLEKLIGPDLTTQEYAVNIISKIIHDDNYFAKTPILDTTAEIIRDTVVNYNHSYRK